VLAQLLGIVGTQLQTAAVSEAVSEIVVREFVDTDLDVEGWYALGHHSTREFLASVGQQESLWRLKRNRVEHLWATISHNHLELFDEAVPDTQPITVIRLF
jgi:hypothetical protein